MQPSCLQIKKKQDNNLPVLTSLHLLQRERLSALQRGPCRVRGTGSLLYSPPLSCVLTRWSLRVAGVLAWGPFPSVCSTAPQSCSLTCCAASQWSCQPGGQSHSSWRFLSLQVNRCPRPHSLHLRNRLHKLTRVWMQAEGRMPLWGRAAEMIWVDILPGRAYTQGLVLCRRQEKVLQPDWVVDERICLFPEISLSPRLPSLMPSLPTMKA